MYIYFSYFFDFQFCLEKISAKYFFDLSVGQSDTNRGIVESNIQFFALSPTKFSEVAYPIHQHIIYYFKSQILISVSQSDNIRG